MVFSFLLSLISLKIGLYELNKYKTINNKIKKNIYIYPLLLIFLFNNNNDYLFNIFFGAITPLLIVHFIIDIKEQELSDFINITIALFAILKILFDLMQNGFSMAIISYILNAISLFVIYLLIAILSKGALGGGDIKLIGALGLFFSVNNFIKLLQLPFLIGGVVALFLLMIKKANNKTTFPFAPAIILSSFLIAIF